MQFRLGVALFVALAMLVSFRSSLTAKDKSSWDVDFHFALGFRYDSNAFKLSDSAKSRLEDDIPADDVSGRFDDMDEVDDFVVRSELEVLFDGPGLGGRDFRIGPSVRYDRHLWNSEKSHPELGLGLRHALGSGRQLRLDLSYELDQFPRNYLADATDLTGNVNAAERVYESGHHDEGVAKLTYRHRLLKEQSKKKRKKKPRFLDTRNIFADVMLGYINRRYDSFDNRDRDAGLGGLRLLFELGKRWELRTGYLFKYISTDNGEEVRILDEPDFGIDFNSDGDTLDNNRRALASVDRSRMDHALELELGFRFAKDWEAWLGYQFLYQDYLSDEPLDTVYNDRTDMRHKVFAGVAWEFARRWRLVLEGLYSNEDSDRRTLAGDVDEEVSYERFVVSLSVEVKLW